MDGAGAVLSSSVVRYFYLKQVTSYATTSSMVLLLHEFLSSFSQEVELVWFSPWSAPKIVYLVNRYSSILMACVYLLTAFFGAHTGARRAARRPERLAVLDLHVPGPTGPADVAARPVQPQPPAAVRRQRRLRRARPRGLGDRHALRRQDPLHHVRADLRAGARAEHGRRARPARAEGGPRQHGQVPDVDARDHPDVGDVHGVPARAHRVQGVAHLPAAGLHARAGRRRRGARAHPRARRAVLRRHHLHARRGQHRDDDRDADGGVPGGVQLQLRAPAHPQLAHPPQPARVGEVPRGPRRRPGRTPQRVAHHVPPHGPPPPLHGRERLARAMRRACPCAHTRPVRPRAPSPLAARPARGPLNPLETTCAPAVPGGFLRRGAVDPVHLSERTRGRAQQQGPAAAGAWPPSFVFTPLLFTLSHMIFRRARCHVTSALWFVRRSLFFA
ncbi:hypothetical protein PsYK624_039320 [Phanerochaete sordida]|uniref:DUF6533 domain-containing protein n=1 Tax=Phanerochaete sordida TaxID=48140 RepID=A0A9P3G401_9APHY|nr:hypothetical protein PsYK624_039320 [Phanerochaete sordida]